MNISGSALSCACAAAFVLAAPPCAARERPAIGAPAPLLAVADLSGIARPLKAHAGPRGLVVLFWAGWSERSVEELQRINAAAADLSSRGVTVAAVSVERYDADPGEARRLRERLDRLHIGVPVFLDGGLELFHAYGVVTVPSTAVIDGQGRLAYFLSGYSHEQREDLFDAIDAVAGIARRAPSPTPLELRVKPASLRRLQLGRLQLSQDHEAPARSSFEEAVKADPTFPDPLVELAALALDGNDAAAARALLDRAAALEANHVGVRRERARLDVLEGRPREARDALETLFTGGGDSTAAAYLGFLLAAAGETARAAAAFDRAKALSGVDPRSYASRELAPAGAAARAMTAYRREVAPGRR